MFVDPLQEPGVQQVLKTRYTRLKHALYRENIRLWSFCLLEPRRLKLFLGPDRPIIYALQALIEYRAELIR